MKFFSEELTVFDGGRTHRARPAITVAGLEYVVEYSVGLDGAQVMFLRAGSREWVTLSYGFGMSGVLPGARTRIEMLEAEEGILRAAVCTRDIWARLERDQTKE